MNKTYSHVIVSTTIVSTAQYVPAYPWCLGADDMPNPDDFADWD